MRNTVLSYLLLPFFTCLSLSLSAAPVDISNATLEQVEASASGPLPQPAKIDLNDADAITLEKELNGIGKAKAEAIVAYREAHGPFESVEELLEIKGVGKALLERNRDKLKVE